MKVILAIAMTCLMSIAETAIAADSSTTLTAGTYTQVFPLVSPSTRVWERIVNVGVAGTAWCSRYNSHPGPNQAGSFPIAPYVNQSGQPSSEEFAAPGFVPQLPLTCTADSTATITAESAP